MTYKLMQVLLDTTPIPEDVLHHIIIPMMQQPIDEAQKAWAVKNAAVMKAFRRCRDFVCVHCNEFHVSTAKNGRFRDQPYRSDAEFMPFCDDCREEHMKQLKRHCRSKTGLFKMIASQRQQQERARRLAAHAEILQVQFGWGGLLLAQLFPDVPLAWLPLE